MGLFNVSLEQISQQLGATVLPIASAGAWIGLGLCSVMVLALIMERSLGAAPQAYYAGRISGAGAALLVSWGCQSGAPLL